MEEIDKKLAAKYPDQANDFSHVTKLELNISDQISGFVSGNSFFNTPGVKKILTNHRVCCCKI